MENQNNKSTKLRIKVPSSNQENSTNNNNSSNSNPAFSNYLQGYDRELDSDQDEPIGFEEHFILKLPKTLTNESNKLRELVESRKEINSEHQNIFFKFMDSRRGIFNIGNQMFGMKLVDLPCIIESQKTFDNKHLFKIADICQMILVEDTPIKDESTVSQGNFNIQDFIYPHGLTPPLNHVRRRRFRKRLNKRTIETVERAVERLLEEDGRADQVIIDIVDNVRDLSDSEGEDYQPPQSATVGYGNQPLRKSISHSKRNTSQPFDSNNPQNSERSKQSRSQQHPHDLDPDGSIQTVTVETPMGESIGAPTPAREEFEDEEEEEGSIDNDLAAEIEAGLMESAAAEERAAAGLTGPEDEEEDENDSEDLFGDRDNDDDDDEEEEEEEEDDDDEETNEMIEDKQRIRLLQGEIKDLESAINRKKIQTSGATNLIVRKRFEEALKKLNLEVDNKKNLLNLTTLNLQNLVLQRQKLKDQSKLDDKISSSQLQPSHDLNLIQPDNQQIDIVDQSFDDPATVQQDPSKSISIQPDLDTIHESFNQNS
ncbi:hypothetical protein H4Q26_015009 [Puccinia striiformis f. sp. tritici PST-130]|nr:hypothetical protein H4Q26_015009 [Puccinia striiformis f. sp. tritici PST-130]